MEADRLKWNEKHRGNAAPGQPVSVVVDHYHKAPSGLALDLACGLGRHSLFLADLGWRVEAMDISEHALSRVQHPNIATVQQDLDHWEPPIEKYALILDLYFLDRSLFPKIERALQPGGLFIMETFLIESNRIENQKFKLQPGELEAAFGHWDFLFQSEANGLASIVAQKPRKS